MSTDPPLPIPDPDPPEEPVFGFADEPPPRPPVSDFAPLEPAPPELAGEAPAGSIDPVQPKQKKRRKKPWDEDDEPNEVGYGEVAEEHRDRILERDDPAAPPGWWIFPTVLVVVGLLLCLVPVVVLAWEKPPGTGAAWALVVCVVVVGQVVAVTVLLTFIGQMFGIDYGPFFESVLKIAGIVAAMDGLTGAVGVVWLPCGLALGMAVGFGLFQSLFRLAIHETLLTVGGIIVSSWALNFVVLSVGAVKP